MGWASHNDVIEHFDFEELSGPDETAGHFNVRFRRLWLAAWVIVRNHRRSGSGHSRQVSAEEGAWN